MGSSSPFAKNSILESQNSHTFCKEKMKVEVEIMSREMIRPSSPTPHHLGHHHLSFLDQTNPRNYVPLVLFYTADRTGSKFSHVQKSDQLKKSLSETLTRFYVLAGRVKGNRFIDCNDEGVLYVEAQVKCQLFEVASDPVPSELNKFVPYEFEDYDNESALGIQVTFFDCGGMAMGVSISHKVADAVAIFFFLSTWSAIARGDIDAVMISPRLEGATLFPPKDTSGYEDRSGIVMDKIVTKRFLFSASSVASLKDKYGDKASKGYYPSRVEALSAFIWSCFMAATQAKKAEPGTIYQLFLGVNLRKILDPPLPHNYFGNVNGLAITVPKVLLGPREEYCYGLVRQIRNEMTKVSADYVKQLCQTDEHLNFRKKHAEKLSKGEIVSLEFSSFCRFPMYETDFGWGKPIWAGNAGIGVRNFIIFSDTRSGGGIEASVTMKEEDMTKFETDKDLLAYVSPTRIAQISRL